ncbi:MAG: FAD-dependent oxidoreductase [Gemmatimonadota bacterium]|jgi:L-2-hydroxyglutarate oxidase LhgO
MHTHPDFLIVGAGIVGLAVALEAQARFPGSTVVVLEKEGAPALHSSGRNSGVLHAGFYYTADSLKARFSREGTRRWTEFCLERKLAINRCGKLVVAKGPNELEGLAELKRRGDRNGVLLHEVTEEEAKGIDPAAKTFERALFSPTTASVDPGEVVRALAEDAAKAGVEIHYGVRARGRVGKVLETSREDYHPGYLINAAGLYADKLARAYGFGQDLDILPFKGLYLYGDPKEHRPRVHIYPVPDLSKPWLGVHFTMGARGEVKIGPTAIPAFWREHYRGWENFDLGEAASILSTEASLFLRNDFGFRNIALDEVKKYARPFLVRQGALLVDGTPMDSFRRWGQPGIRAQLFHRRERKMLMDFYLEGDEGSLHVLNAVSPAFTCALPFAEFVMDEVEARRSGRRGGIEDT